MMLQVAYVGNKGTHLAVVGWRRFRGHEYASA